MSGEGETAAAARELLTAMTLQPSGQVSPSVYETGRLVALAPWLTGHVQRLDYLLANQRVDGGWGAPGGYALVPTLSAVEALLSTLRAGDEGRRPDMFRGELAAVANRGLHALSGWLSAGEQMSVPDTPAVDLIVPALIGEINQHLQRLRDRPCGANDEWRGGWLPLPPGADHRRLDAVGRLLASGRSVPQKLLHAFEVLGGGARRRGDVSPVAGTIGASPAATAAWLGDPAAGGADPAALSYLEDAARQQGGPVPCCTPITVFERAWVLSSLTRVGVPLAPTAKLVAELSAALGPEGTPTGPGLPADADTTSVTLYALARLNHPVDPESLFLYDMGTHFCTWQGEDGYSTTTNAHVLDVLGWHARCDVPAAARYSSKVATLARWLCEQQHADGHWSDRWHASPYYATSCAVLPLDRYAPAAIAGEAVDRAIDWVVDTQRVDGSWGRWGGTVEETAYALHVLLGVGRSERPGVRAAAMRGLDHIAAADGQEGEPPLWHDKDLYSPTLIVRAATLAVWHLASTRSDLVSTPHWKSARPIDESCMIRSA